MAGKLNKTEMLNSKNFCMLPWTHLHFWPDNSTHLCCISDSTKPIGKYDGSIIDLANSENIKKVRNNMLADKPSAECNRCYELEKAGIYSLRNNANVRYAKYFDEVEQTKDDGSIEKFTMRYLDIRFSNLCNLKCRSCGPDLSSSWYDDQKAMHPSWEGQKLFSISPQEKFWEDILPSLNHTEEAYFAGGEPLITDEIYKIMDYWLEHNKTDIEIGFTTNFTRLSYKDKNILDYWKKFPKLTVSASLDASGERAEYMRKGTIWKNIVANRKKMMEICPEVKFELTPTISVFNIWHFPDFHYEWLKEGLVSHENLRLNILTSPDYMSFKIIKPAKREVLINKWKMHYNLIAKEFSLDPQFYNKTLDSYKLIINALENLEYESMSKEFFKRNRIMDTIRKENFYSVFPEMGILL